MTRTEHLLTILAEECAEVAQRVSKALRFGLHEVQEGHSLDNSDRILAELRDLEVAVNMLLHEGALKMHPAFETTEGSRTRGHLVLILVDCN